MQIIGMDNTDSEPEADGMMDSRPYSLGMALLGVPVTTFLIGALGLALGIPVTGWPAALSIISMLGLVWRTSGDPSDTRRKATVSAAFLGIVATCIAYSGWMHDLSWDGQAYHQEAIIQLMDGWNPFRQTSLPFEIMGDGYNRWIDHYAKAPWICAASLARLMGGIEYGKAFGPMLLISSMLLSFTVLGRRLPGWQAGLFAGLVCVSPVVFSQLGSYYVDGPLASLFVCSLALMHLSAGNPGPTTLIPMSGSLVLLANTKFTGAVDAAILALAMGSWALTARVRGAGVGGKRIAITMAITGMVALAAGYQPYIVNLCDHGHPMYPVMGPKYIDVIERQINPAFAARNPLYKAIYSLFARTENNLQSYPVLKTPLAVTKYEIDTMAAVDVRIGGFGPWFGPLALLATLVLAVQSAILAYHRDPRLCPALLAGLALAAVTGFANPEAWWARFSPQLWLLGPGSLAIIMVQARASWVKGVACAIAAMLAINLGMAVWAVSNSIIPGNRLLRQQLRSLAEYTRSHPPVVAAYGYFPSNRKRLEEAGVRVRDVSGLQPVNVVQLVRSDTYVFMY